MLIYTTKFPINDTLTKEQFVKTIIKWNQGSKYDKIDEIIWDEKTFDCSWEQINIILSIKEVKEKLILASRLRKEDEYGIWCTDFVLDNMNKMLSVSVSLEITEFTTDFFPKYYPPFFVKMILHGNFAGNDNGLLVLNKEHIISECFDIFKGIVNKEILSKLPVVYIARTKLGENPLDVNRLAFRLQGVAHVICEPDKGITLKGFSDLLDNNDTREGKIFIYYPSYNKKSRVINLTGSCQEDYLEDNVVNNIYNYMISRIRNPIDTWDGVLIEKLYYKNKQILATQMAIEEENKNLYDVFGEQLEKMEESNRKLSNEVQRLTAEIQGLRMRYLDKDKSSVLYFGDEKEFYTDEIKEIVLDIMYEYRKKCKENSRRWHIISDLLECNEFRGLPEKRKEQLKNALKGYKKLNGSLKCLLEILGFEISDDGKHYKWTYYGDHRYVVTAAKSCSDERAGMNLSSVIEKLMF